MEMILHCSPYMLLKEEKRRIVPGVTHVDGSGRLQTITEDMNPRYYHLISEFQKISGVPMIVNTSFNIKGEPIIESPTDAVRCFLGSGIDYLVMNDFVVEKIQ